MNRYKLCQWGLPSGAEPQPKLNGVWTFYMQSCVILDVFSAFSEASCQE